MVIYSVALWRQRQSIPPQIAVPSCWEVTWLAQCQLVKQMRAWSSPVCNLCNDFGANIAKPTATNHKIKVPKLAYITTIQTGATPFYHTTATTLSHTHTLQAKLGSVSSGEMEASSSQQLSSLSSEQRLRDLELELAQTKLALVESQCKNQELEHKVDELHFGQSKGLNRLFSKKKW